MNKNGKRGPIKPSHKYVRALRKKLPPNSPPTWLEVGEAFEAGQLHERSAQQQEGDSGG